MHLSSLLLYVVSNAWDFLGTNPFELVPFGRTILLSSKMRKTRKHLVATRLKCWKPSVNLRCQLFQEAETTTSTLHPNDIQHV